MRALFGVLVVVALLLSVGCGAATDTTAGEPSEVPDAVVTAPADEPSSSVTVDTADGGEATVVIDKAGFSYESEYDAVDYGLVLKNTSGMDATQVQVSVNFMDKADTILVTEDLTINVIPAGETYYLGGGTYSEDGRPKKMEAFVDVGASESAQYPLPSVSKVRVVKDEWGSLYVKGQVKNDLDEPLSSIAAITCVVFDKNGKVVGGSQTFLDRDLPSGRTAGFEFMLTATPASKAASAMASMDNMVAF